MSYNGLEAVKAQLARQVTHWSIAVDGLSDFSRLASSVGWRSLERYLGVAIEKMLRQAVLGLRREANTLEAELEAAETAAQIDRLRVDLLAFRGRFLAVEKELDYYGDAINTRTDERLGTYLRACDVLAFRAMNVVLEPLGRKPPPVLTYFEPGLGASILKAGLPLWDGRSVSPVAAIKMVRHNLYRPTSLLHEAGHQAAHILSWNDELAGLLQTRLARHGASLAEMWSSWASEIAADVFAFSHTGYAALAALCDVLAGDPDWVMQHVAGDPHPVGYLRILLGRAMCVRFFGSGAWDDLARAWARMYPIENARGEMQELMQRSIDLLPEIVEILFFEPMRAFAGHCMTGAVDPARVKPEALLDLEQRAGEALFSSDHWITKECLRLVAISGLRATVPGEMRAVLEKQEEWMWRLGRIVASA